MCFYVFLLFLGKPMCLATWLKHLSCIPLSFFVAPAFPWRDAGHDGDDASADAGGVVGRVCGAAVAAVLPATRVQYHLLHCSLARALGAKSSTLGRPGRPCFST